MSGVRYGISTSEITWEQEESEIEQNNTGKVTIQAVGSIGVGSGDTPLDDALVAIPFEIPISNTGPIGNSIILTGAIKATQGARYLGDDTIQVRASYEIASPVGLNDPGEGELPESDSDRAIRTIVAEDAPLLSHPLAQSFPETDRRLLSSLLEGNIWVNPRFLSGGEEDELREFIRETEDPDDNKTEEATFSSSTVTDNGVTASPLDYARLIASGVITWRRPTIRHSLSTSRENPAPNAQYGAVGEAVSGTPKLAPTLSDDGQWFLNGITDTTENGITWETQYEYERTGAGGALKAIYKGGTAEIT